MTIWPNDNIRKTDVTVSKNYLAEAEIKELNRLTTILLDIFEDQLDLGHLATMSDVRAVLDNQLVGLRRVVLRDGGSTSKTVADNSAHHEFAKFKQARKLSMHKKTDRELAELARQTKGLPRTRR